MKTGTTELANEIFRTIVIALCVFLWGIIVGGYLANNNINNQNNNKNNTGVINMTNMTANVLGTPYRIEFRTIAEDEDLRDDGGYCDYESRLIVIIGENPDKINDFERLQRHYLRHELIHAFMAESGLANNFQHVIKWGHEETMVDWFAIQFPKIKAEFERLGIED